MGNHVTERKQEIRYLTVQIRKLMKITKLTVL